MKNLRTADTAEIVAWVNSFDEWDAEQYEALCELATRAGIDPDDYRDDDGAWDKTHEFVTAIQSALAVDLGE